MKSGRGRKRAAIPSLPTIEECERALGLRSDRWVGNCHSVACGLVEAGLVPGSPRYGFYYGPVAETSYFSHTAPFHRHGWIELPGGLAVVDPTRWVFEDRAPYLYRASYSRHYDPGGQRLILGTLKPCPGRMPGDEVLAVNLSVEAAQHLSDMTGFGTAFSLGQLFWIANLPLAMLHPHHREVYLELKRIGKGALIPIDNFSMATGPGGPPPHVLRVD